MHFKARSENFSERVEKSFAAQTAMQTLGIRLDKVLPGNVTLKMPFADILTQQHGFIHAGIITTAMDSACGYAAFSLMDDESEVLTVEFKTNLLAPAAGEHFLFDGSVVKSGRALTVCEGKAFALSADKDDRLVATMSATMMAVRKRSDVKQRTV